MVMRIVCKDKTVIYKEILPEYFDIREEIAEELSQGHLAYYEFQGKVNDRVDLTNWSFEEESDYVYNKGVSK